MKLKIKASSFFTSLCMEVRPAHVILYESAFIGGRRTFAYEQIDHVYLSADSKLSLQMGKEMFTIPVRRDKPLHQQTVQALLDNLAPHGVRPA